MIDMIYNTGLGLLSADWWATLAWPVIWTLIKIVVVVAPLMGGEENVPDDIKEQLSPRWVATVATWLVLGPLLIFIFFFTIFIFFFIIVFP